MDNICGDLDFEEGGNPVVMNRVPGFKDPVLCDSFAAESMGHRARDMLIYMPEQLGVGSTDVEHARLISISEGAPDMKTMRRSRRVTKLAAYADAKGACSACYGSLIYALDRLSDEGRLRGHKTGEIAIGQGYR